MNGVWRRGAASGSTGRRDSSSDEVQVLAALPPQPRKIRVRVTSTITSAFTCDSPIPLTSRQRFFKPPKAFNQINADLTLPENHAFHPFLMNVGNQFATAFEKRFTGAGRKSGEYSFARGGNSRHVQARVLAYGDNIAIPVAKIVESFECDSEGDILELYADEIRAFSIWASSRLSQMSRLAFEVEDSVYLKHLKFPRRHSMIEIGFTEASTGESRSKMAKFLSEHRRQLISAHIALSPSAVLDPRLERELVSSNSELNLKSESHSLLLNAQGSLFLREDSSRSAPRGDSGLIRAPYDNRFENVSHLSQIALLLQHVGLTASDEGELDSRGWASSSNALRQWVKYSNNALYRSVGNAKIWDVLRGAYHLDSILEEVSERVAASREEQWDSKAERK